MGTFFGEGNVWADAESRGYDDALTVLSAQLGVTPSDAPVPPHAIALLNRVRSAIRNRPLAEGELRDSKAYSEGYTGDGPVSLAVFAGRVVLPPSALALQTQGDRSAGHLAHLDCASGEKLCEPHRSLVAPASGATTGCALPLLCAILWVVFPL